MQTWRSCGNIGRNMINYRLDGQQNQFDINYNNNAPLPPAAASL